ncbi:atherin-like [Panicum hallii]|uniref:atherin-like n=1 Tax=Panicum hallii TaxID=206008 RepID=UPI000DF4CEB9|nr:atherin-like [Panicum hallii]
MAAPRPPACASPAPARRRALGTLSARSAPPAQRPHLLPRTPEPQPPARPAPAPASAVRLDAPHAAIVGFRACSTPTRAALPRAWARSQPHCSGPPHSRPLPPSTCAGPARRRSRAEPHTRLRACAGSRAPPALLAPVPA